MKQRITLKGRGRCDDVKPPCSAVCIMNKTYTPLVWCSRRGMKVRVVTPVRDLLSDQPPVVADSGQHFAVSECKMLFNTKQHNKTWC